MIPILIDGQWRASSSQHTFRAVNPATKANLPDSFPISNRTDVEAALNAAFQAFDELRTLPSTVRIDFLERYADRIESKRKEITAKANEETSLAVEPRLNSNELPRTTDQLRQAAKAVREKNWQMPTIDAAKNIRSMFIPLGPVFVLGPNNFPLAYNSVSGGDFASAIACGCPVIAKGHPAHPGTTYLLAQEANEAAKAAGLPTGVIQCMFHMSNEDGAFVVADSRIGSVAFTGSRTGGLLLKKVADSVGKPIFLEMGSLNPVILLPASIEERGKALLDEVTGSCLLGMGQFCTNPGLILFLAGAGTEAFIASMKEHYQSAAVGTLLTEGVQNQLHASIDSLIQSGAELLAGGRTGSGVGFSHQHTLLRITAQKFISNPHALQKEAFGNATLTVVCQNKEELKAILRQLKGQLCGSIYSDSKGGEDVLYGELEPILRQRVGRLLNDKMPTGVAVTSAMNHGGPFPASGHPHFTAVGFPASIRRFCMLACYDNVRPDRLPLELRSG